MFAKRFYKIKFWDMTFNPSERKIKMKEKTISAWERVVLARKAERPKSLDYINNIFTNFIELHGDRNFGDDKSIIGGIAELDEMPVTVIGEQKGKNAKEKIDRNFGMPNPEGYRKALRLMRQAEKFDRPIITFVDTPGAYPGVEAEEHGQGEAIARNLAIMSGLKVPIISIIIGQGNSGGALGICVADEIWMLENSVFSILSPEGFASILWKDSSRRDEACELMKLTAQDLYNYKIIDGIINEPDGGAHMNPEEVIAKLDEMLYERLNVLSILPKEVLIKNRYKKYRVM